LKGEHDLPLLIAINLLFASWYRQNTRSHKVSAYRIVYLSLKNHGQAPGDINE